MRKFKRKSGNWSSSLCDAGGRGIENVQPLVFRSTTGSLAIAHNGNIVNASRFKTNILEKQGSIFQTTSDTEVLAHLMKKSGSGSLNERDRVKKALSMLKGAFAFVMLTEDGLLLHRIRMDYVHYPLEN